MLAGNPFVPRVQRVAGGRPCKSKQRVYFQKYHRGQYTGTRFRDQAPDLRTSPKGGYTAFVHTARWLVAAKAGPHGIDEQDLRWHCRNRCGSRSRWFMEPAGKWGIT